MRNRTCFARKFDMSRCVGVSVLPKQKGGSIFVKAHGDKMFLHLPPYACIKIWDA